MFDFLRVCAVATLLCAPAFADSIVQLRPRIEARGAAVLMGDVFEGAGAASDRPIAPAPAPGQSLSLAPDFLSAVAQSAGLQWSAPAGLTSVQVTRTAPSARPPLAIGAAATLPPRAPRLQPASVQQSEIGAFAVRRGQMVMLVHQAPGLRITTRVRALADGQIGDAVALHNPASNRTLHAVVTGPGVAATSAP